MTTAPTDAGDAAPATTAPADAGDAALATTAPTNAGDAAPTTAAPTDAGDAGPATCVPVPQGIVSWWTGDQTFADLEGKNDGTVSGPTDGGEDGGISFAAGEVGQAFRFDGTQWVEVPDSPSLYTYQLTIEAWIEPEVNEMYGRILDKIPAGTHSGYLLDLFGGDPRFLIAGWTIQSQPPVTGQFSHIAGTWDGAFMRLYLNGQLVAGNASPSSSQTTACPLLIGADQNGDSNFVGLIDELSVYNRALEQSEIQAIYEAWPRGKCK